MFSIELYCITFIFPFFICTYKYAHTKTTAEKIEYTLKNGSNYSHAVMDL